MPKEKQIDAVPICYQAILSQPENACPRATVIKRESAELGAMLCESALMFHKLSAYKLSNPKNTVLHVHLHLRYAICRHKVRHPVFKLQKLNHIWQAIPQAQECAVPFTIQRKSPIWISMNQMGLSSSFLAN